MFKLIRLRGVKLSDARLSVTRSRVLRNLSALVAWVAWVALSFASMSLAGGSADKLSDSKTRNEHQKVLVIADSIGNGHGLATPWPELLRRATSLTIINHSVSSMETEWGLQQTEPMLTLHAPTDVLIMLGTNDASRTRDLNQSLKNLQAMIDLSAKAKANVFVMTILPIEGKKYMALDQRTMVLNEGIKQLQAAQIIDVRSAFDDSDHLMADSLHPNQNGQQLIYTSVAQALGLSEVELP